MNKIYNNESISRFIVLQPIIDIITSLLINEFNMTISLGMLIRFLFLIYEAIYLLKKRNKNIIMYFILLALYCLTSLVGFFFLKNNFSLFTHIIFLVKMVYFPTTLLFFYYFFKDKKLLTNKVFQHIVIIIGVSLVLSLITNTSYCSYITEGNCMKGGVLGWFNSANEISVILSCLLGLMLVNHLKRGNALSYICLLIVVIFLSVIGTKTAILAIVGILITFIIYYLLSLIKGKEKIILFKRVLSIIPILTFLALSINYLPIHYNLVESIKYASTDLIEKKEEEVSNSPEEEVNKNEVIYNQVVFQGRNDYIIANKKIYDNSNIFFKLFGLTNQDNYYEDGSLARINERDFHDSLMFYGIIGFILILLLPLSLIVKLIINLKNNLKVLYDDEFFIMAITNLLVLGISYLAGHILFQPAACIYFAYLIVTIMRLSEENYE